MRILLFHPTLLPPRNYGGVERVLLWLAKGLIERGHQVYIAALRGSVLPHGCELVEVEEKSYSANELNPREFSPNQFKPNQLNPNEFNIQLNLKMPAKLDMIHFMAPVRSEVWS